MKIAVLSSHTPSLFWFRMDMMQAFLAQGHEVWALGNEDERVWSDKFAANGIIYRRIVVSRNGVNPLNDLKTLHSIKSVLRQIRPDKLFTYQAKTVIYGGIAAHQLGIAEVYSLIAGVGSIFMKNDLKTTLIRSIMVMEYRMGMRHNSAVFFQNSDDEALFRSFGIVKNHKTVRIMGSGVNTEKYRPMPFPEIFGFLCISRLIRDKGVYEYLEAARRVKAQRQHIRCLLVGPFDTNPSAIKPEELQPFLDDGSVEYFGEQEDICPYMEQCSVFVLPSYREGTPKTNLEAMACGRPVITTDAPGCRETIMDGASGFLVPIKDVDALCEKMLYLVDHPAELSKMGQAGTDRAVTVFDVRIVNGVICDTMGL